MFFRGSTFNNDWKGRVIYHVLALKFVSTHYILQSCLSINLSFNEMFCWSISSFNDKMNILQISIVIKLKCILLRHKNWDKSFIFVSVLQLGSNPWRYILTMKLGGYNVIATWGLQCRYNLANPPYNLATLTSWQ